MATVKIYYHHLMYSLVESGKHRVQTTLLVLFYGAFNT